MLQIFKTLYKASIHQDIAPQGDSSVESIDDEEISYYKCKRIQDKDNGLPCDWCIQRVHAECEGVYILHINRMFQEESYIWMCKGCSKDCKQVMKKVQSENRALHEKN